MMAVSINIALLWSWLELLERSGVMLQFFLSIFSLAIFRAAGVKKARSLKSLDVCSSSFAAKCLGTP